jgi:hypothetical protein
MHLSEITPETAKELLKLSLQAELDPETCIPDRYRCFFVTGHQGWQLSDDAFDTVMQLQGIHLAKH